MISRTTGSGLSAEAASGPSWPLAKTIMMKTTEDMTGDLFVYGFPFWFAVLMIGGILLSAGGFLIALASPILMVVSILCLGLAVRKCKSAAQRIIIGLLNLVALAFYSYVTWGLYMLWRIGPLQH